MPAAAKLVVVVLFTTDRAGGTIAIDVEATLLAGLPSLPAPVVPVTVVVPVAVGVPETVQLMALPGATDVGGVGEHVDVSPGGSAPTEQLAAVAMSVPTLVQL